MKSRQWSQSRSDAPILPDPKRLCLIRWTRFSIRRLCLYDVKLGNQSTEAQILFLYPTNNEVVGGRRGCILVSLRPGGGGVGGGGWGVGVGGGVGGGGGGGGVGGRVAQNAGVIVVLVRLIIHFPGDYLYAGNILVMGYMKARELIGYSATLKYNGIFCNYWRHLYQLAGRGWGLVSGSGHF